MSKQLNFAQQMDEVLKTLGDARPKLLLHACCGPCSSAVLEQLCAHFEITVLYYNPNTWPAEEYHRRESGAAKTRHAGLARWRTLLYIFNSLPTKVENMRT